MEELTLDSLQDTEPKQALIEVVQLPVIVEHLHTLKAEIEQQASEAMSLACSPETLADVKAARARLNQRKAEMEEARKRIKAAIMAPYEQFEAVYRSCVTDPLNAADQDLKQKISDTEFGIIVNCRNEMKEYFNEQITAYGIEWLEWERMGIRISLTEAQKKRHQKLRESIAAYTVGVAQDVKAISSMDHAEEIMVEYKRCLNLSKAQITITERYEQIERERKQREEWEARQKAEAESVQKVEKAAAATAAATTPAPAPIPTPVQAPAPAAAPAPEKVYKLKFAITGTKPQLVDFKKFLIAYCEERGLRYE